MILDVFTPISFVCDFQGGGSHLEFFKKVYPSGIPSELP